MTVIKSMKAGRIFSVIGGVKTMLATIIGHAELYFPVEVSIHIRNKIHYNIRDAVECND